MAAESKQVASLESTGKADASAWLYSEQGGKLGGKSFIVGQAKRKIYGLVPSLVAKCQFFGALADDIKALEGISEQAPWPLLADDKHFTEGIPAAFAFVWNYLNGTLPEIITVKRVGPGVPPVCKYEIYAKWPMEMTLEDKYMVIFYADYFGIPTESIFVIGCTDLLAEDFVRELTSTQTRWSWEDIARRTRLIDMAVGLRAAIKKVSNERLMQVGRQLPSHIRNDFLYGKRSSQIPATYHEIYPAMQAAGSGLYNVEFFSYEQLANAKDLIAQVTDGKEIFPITKVELVPYNAWSLSNLGLRMGDTARHPDGKMIVLTTPKTKLIQSGHNSETLPWWVAPQLEPENQNQSRRLHLRFFASALNKLEQTNPTLIPQFVTPAPQSLASGI